MPRSSTVASHTDSAAAASKPPTFEAAMSELETVVREMENDQIPLASLLENYARGKQLLVYCQTKIDEAQQRVELIAAGAEGAILHPFTTPSPNSPEPSDDIKLK